MPPSLAWLLATLTSSWQDTRSQPTIPSFEAATGNKAVNAVASEHRPWAAARLPEATCPFVFFCTAGCPHRS